MRFDRSDPRLRRELNYLGLYVCADWRRLRSATGRHGRAVVLMIGAGLALSIVGVVLILTWSERYSQHQVPSATPTSGLDRRPAERQPVEESQSPPVPTTGPRVVTVGPGDTLGSIAVRTGVPIEQIVADNHIDDPRLIRPGRRLSITACPSGVEVIPRGATLTGYASRFGTTVRRLRQLNPQITDPDHILAGGALRVR